MSLLPFTDVTTGRWADITARVGRNDKPALLFTSVMTGALADVQEIRTALEDTWTTCEWPGRAADYELWLSVFEMASKDGHYLHETEPRPRDELPESMTVYRASARGHELGL